MEPNFNQPEQNLEPEQDAGPYPAELAVKSASGGKEKVSRFLNSSGLSWLLIVLVLVLMALAVNIFKQPVVPGISGNMGASLEPTLDIRQPRVYTVSYRNGVFGPTNLRIHAGDTVRFKNEGIFPIRIVSDPHPEHSGLVGFDSIGDIPQGSFFSFTFAARGIFGYHNEKDPDKSATIIIR